MNKMIEIAKKYIAAGFSVIPVENKRPAVEWKEYQTRYATDEELASWFPRFSQIGIVTGKISGITVVDVDVKSGGLESLKELRLPPTWTVKTGGGGWHYYYKYDERVQQTQAIYKGIDIRNDGGQVVAPSSLHESGKRYEWTYKDGDLTEIPVDLFAKKQLVKKDWAELLKVGTKEGSRNGTAASLFGKLMTMFTPEEWDTVWEIGMYWNKHNDPPLDDDELKRVFESIKKKAIHNDRGVDELLDDTQTPTDIAQRVLEKDKERKKFFTWGSDDIDREFPIIEYHTYMVLFGQAGSGKTTFAMSLARKNENVCLLTLEMSREKLIKQYAFHRAGIEKEQYRQGNYDESIFTEYAKELDSIKILGVDEESTKQDYTYDDLEKIVSRHDIDLLIIDNFNKLIGSGQSDINADNNTSSKLLFLTRQYNVAIVVIHHTNKQQTKDQQVLRGMSGMRGTSKLNDDADIVCELGRDKETNLTKIAVYKDRDWDATVSLDLEFKNGTFTPARGLYSNNPIINNIQF